jgi:trigger factor
VSQTTLPQPTAWKNDQVQVTVHRDPACKIRMEVVASAELVKQARKEAIKRAGKDKTLPGFRKGKAPEELIVKNFPHSVEMEWHKTIADAAFAAAQKSARVPVLNNHSPISFDLKKHSLEQGAELLFTFETEPAVPSIDPGRFTLRPVPKGEVDEKQIEEAIRQMRFFYAEWKPVTERGVQEGDYILIDLDTIDGEKEEQVFRHIRFEVSKERMAEWMQKLVIGAKAGSVLEGVSEPDATASPAEKEEFRPKKVRLTLIKVEEASLPPFDDEFAKKVGAQDAAAARASVTQILQSRLDEKALSEEREQVNDFLVETYPFDLPVSLIETEKKHRLDQMLTDASFKKQWDQKSGAEKEEVEKKLFEESEQAVRLFYLSRQVVHDAKLPVTHKEVQDEAVSTLRAFGSQSLDPTQIPKEVYALSLSKVILAKAQDHILKNLSH